MAAHSEADLEILAKFFIETCHSLLGVNKDLINRELHRDGSFEILKTFASDKNQRSLVFSKVDKSSAANSEEVKQAVAKAESFVDPQDDTGVQLFISNKVEYQGISAMTIAFLKREPYKHLYLKDNEKKIEIATPGGD